jgi:hypothetical protein
MPGKKICAENPRIFTAIQKLGRPTRRTNITFGCFTVGNNAGLARVKTSLSLPEARVALAARPSFLA